MSIGSLVYPTEQGLGILAKSFVDNGVVTDVLVVEHAHWENLPWYPTALRTPIRPLNVKLAQSFCRSVDLMLFFETPFYWPLINYCRLNEVKTVLMPMYECTPEKLPALPDAFFCPSALDYNIFRSDHPDSQNIHVLHTPVPVDVSWRLRTKAEVFVHNAGRGGLKNRNGTGVLIDAMKYVKSPIKLILTSQSPLQWSVNDPRIELRVGSVPYEELWKDGGVGDVFVFPETFNGLSLPLQEAYAAGMLVMATDRFPMNEWLPSDPLIPVSSYKTNRINGCIPFQEAIVDPKELAMVIDEWYGRDIDEYSLAGGSYALDNSWSNLKPMYMERLQCV